MTFDPMDLPEIAEWVSYFDGGPLGVIDYVGEQVGPVAAVALARLFWPGFVRVDGCILLEDRYDEQTFRNWQAELESRAAIEAAVNHIHLWDVFGASSDSIPDEAMEFLGHVVAKTWASAVAAAFPDEDMLVKFSNDPEDYGPTVTVRSRS